MRDLGGPTSSDRIQAIHERRLASVLANTVWWFTIIPDQTIGPVGTIGIWESQFEASRINEMGWMLLPANHGRGLATEAGRIILERARIEKRFDEVHAFPSINNAASNAICKNLGFSLLQPVQLAYNGPPQSTNHWHIRLAG